MRRPSRPSACRTSNTNSNSNTTNSSSRAPCRRPYNRPSHSTTRRASVLPRPCRRSPPSGGGGGRRRRRRHRRKPRHQQILVQQVPLLHPPLPPTIRTRRHPSKGRNKDNSRSRSSTSSTSTSTPWSCSRPCRPRPNSPTTSGRPCSGRERRSPTSDERSRDRSSSSRPAASGSSTPRITMVPVPVVLPPLEMVAPTAPFPSSTWPPSWRRRNAPSASAAAAWSTTFSPGRSGGSRRPGRSRPSSPSSIYSGGSWSGPTSVPWTIPRPSAPCLPRPPVAAERRPLRGPPGMRPRPGRSILTSGRSTSRAPVR
mmetsp:Transcript_7914/g.22030  ORF Transcript_7914/g.22030 Transcript_7914/m.22030 type:complete len:312 (+) Transcript_7914:740-1675(+)